MLYLGPKTNMYMCSIVSTLPPLYGKIWVAKLVNEGIMFGLALTRGIRSLREVKGMTKANRLMVVLVKDSILYFFA